MFLYNQQLTDEVLKFTVINRGGRKSIPTYRNQHSMKPPRYHGFGMFVLSQLPPLENSNLPEDGLSNVKIYISILQLCNQFALFLPKYL